MLRDTVAVAVVRTRPRAIPLAIITMRKSIHGFPSVFYMGMGLRLAAPFSFAINKTVAKFKMILNEICDLTDWLIKIEKINKET